MHAEGENMATQLADRTEAERLPTVVRGAVHTIVILGALVPASAFVPVYHYAAPILLPALWFAAAIGGRVLRAIHALLTAFVAMAVVGMARWGFTRCEERDFELLTIAIGIAFAAVLVSTARSGPSWRAFAPYGALVAVLLVVLVAALMNYNPAGNEFFSPGCP